MARYRLLATSYINERVLPEGTVIGEGTDVPFDGPPGPHMEPVDTAAKRAMADYHAAHPHATLDPWRLPVVSAYERAGAALSDGAS